MRICAIKNCHSRRDDENILYFSFPMQDEKLLKSWLDRINNTDWKPDENSQICSAHFRFYDFDRTEKGLLLKSNAVPTIFPNVIYVYSTNSSQDIPGFKNLVNEKKDTQIPKIVSAISLDKPVFRTPEVCVTDRAKVPTTNGFCEAEPQDVESEEKLSAPGMPPPLANPVTPKNGSSSQGSLKKLQTKLGNKVPVLRISVNKKCNSTSYTNGAVKKRKHNNGVNEIEACSGGKSVIFRLDPKTKKILVLKKDKEECTDDSFSRNESSTAHMKNKKKSSQPIRNKSGQYAKEQNVEQKEIMLRKKEVSNTQKKKLTNRKASSQVKKTSEREEMKIIFNKKAVTKPLERKRNQESENHENGKRQKLEEKVENSVWDENIYEDFEYLDPEFIY